MSQFPLFDDKNVKYNGSSSSNLNVEQGEPIGNVLDKLVIALSALIDKVNSCSFCEGEDNSISLDASNITATNTLSQNSTITSGAAASIKTTPNATGVNVNFNLDPVINSLGSNVTVLKTKTSINGLRNGAPAKIVDTTDKTSISANLRPDNFPATIETEVRYKDSTGEKTISLIAPLSSVQSEVNLPLQGKAASSVEVKNQGDLNTNLQDRLLNVENLVTSLNNVNISGFNTNLPANSNINTALSFILSEIESIKGQLPSS